MRSDRILIVLILCLHFLNANSQFIEAKIGVNGLTCSACTRSVESNIKKLPFVESISSNEEKSTAVIKFNTKQAVNINSLAKAVFDAGFSVRFLVAEYSFSKLESTANEISDHGYHFNFIKGKPKELKSSLRFIGSIFQTKSEFTRFKKDFPSLNFENKEVYFVVPVEN